LKCEWTWGSSLNEIFGGFINDVYIACFSEKRDLLSQWRGYGANGEGYVIGIDPCSIEVQNEFINNSTFGVVIT
jgi:hypothetical protein